MTTPRSPAARRFLFGEDLRQATVPPLPDVPAGPDPAELAAQQRRISEIEAAAFARGHEAGRAEADAAIARQQTEALSRIADGANRVLAELDGRMNGLEDDGVQFFSALAEALAGRALAREPLSTVSDAAREAFRHLRGVPHLVARVHESLVEPVDTMLRRMARENGFEGRIVVLGADDMAVGDARLEWADGAVAAERAAIDRSVREVLARADIAGTPEGLEE